MNKIAIIGAGVSGLTIANLLKERHCVTVFEKESTPGGLIRCKRINGSLYHICGGHVFNSKHLDVLNWFWGIFDKEKEFIKTDRNSVVFMEDQKMVIPYPIENHIYLFDDKLQKDIINDFIKIIEKGYLDSNNFEEFLKNRFGETLYNIYFQPYNEKIWKRDLKNVPLLWLEGKLPMSSVSEMIYNNINQIKEKQFVHSTFWYEKENGSQYIANKLAQNLNIRYNSNIKAIEKKDGKWSIGNEIFDSVIFCGNIKELPHIIKGVNLIDYENQIEKLEYHGTTSVFCEIEANPYSWIYLPSRKYSSHRIICTGNFSPTNNANHKITATIEFTDELTEVDIKENLQKTPFNPRYLSHHYNQYTYPIQDKDTRNMIESLKKYLSLHNFYFTGRFADWEYYNMDVAIKAAMETCKTYNLYD